MLTSKEILNKICEDRDQETVRAMRRLARRVDKNKPYELNLQILIQYALVK